MTDAAGPQARTALMAVVAESTRDEALRHRIRSVGGWCHQSRCRWWPRGGVCGRPVLGGGGGPSGWFGGGVD
ncbi:hypothetical protein BGK67_04980 [Streptomyces subrutilus]|uniref:Uncharacterized protein n=1 Tax=Streptomyces subrutilus TaxID=36818 RepID=A0A1E5PMI1_9ACTN|nr:hypothetical protein BGK67_04980 [Streptomyces subrutilus]